eukprot:Nk52_evm39s2402 gene=Nk52_evmTU39s2402
MSAESGGGEGRHSLSSRSFEHAEYLSRCQFLSDVHSSQCSEFYADMYIVGVVISAISSIHALAHFIYAVHRFRRGFFFVPSGVNNHRSRGQENRVDGSSRRRHDDPFSSQGYLRSYKINPLMIQLLANFLFCFTRLVFNCLILGRKLANEYVWSAVLFNLSYCFGVVSIFSYYSLLVQFMDRMYISGINVINVGSNFKITQLIRKFIIKQEQKLFFALLAALLAVQLGLAVGSGMTAMDEDSGESLKLSYIQNWVWLFIVVFLVVAGVFLCWWIIEVMIDNCSMVSFTMARPKVGNMMESTTSTCTTRTTSVGESSTASSCAVFILECDEHDESRPSSYHARSSSYFAPPPGVRPVGTCSCPQSPVGARGFSTSSSVVGVAVVRERSSGHERGGNGGQEKDQIINNFNAGGQPTQTRAERDGMGKNGENRQTGAIVEKLSRKRSLSMPHLNAEDDGAIPRDTSTSHLDTSNQPGSSRSLHIAIERAMPSTSGIEEQSNKRAKAWLPYRLKQSWPYLRHSTRRLIIRSLVFSMSLSIMGALLCTALMIFILAYLDGKEYATEKNWEFNCSVLVLLGFFSLNITQILRSLDGYKQITFKRRASKLSALSKEMLRKRSAALKRMTALSLMDNREAGSPSPQSVYTQSPLRKRGFSDSAQTTDEVDLPITSTLSADKGAIDIDRNRRSATGPVIEETHVEEP